MKNKENKMLKIVVACMLLWVALILLVPPSTSNFTFVLFFSSMAAGIYMIIADTIENKKKLGIYLFVIDKSIIKEVKKTKGANKWLTLFVTSYMSISIATVCMPYFAATKLKRMIQ